MSIKAISYTAAAILREVEAFQAERTKAPQNYVVKEVPYRPMTQAELEELGLTNAIPKAAYTPDPNDQYKLTPKGYVPKKCLRTQKVAEAEARLAKLLGEPVNTATFNASELAVELNGETINATPTGQLTVSNPRHQTVLKRINTRLCVKCSDFVH